MHFRSLKNRLVLAGIVWIGFGLLAAYLTLTSMFRHYLDRELRAELFVHLKELQRLAQFGPDGAHLQRPFSDPRYEIARSGYYWQIQSADRVLARSASLQSEKLSPPADIPPQTDVHVHSFNGPTGQITVAETAHTTDQAQGQIRFMIGTDNRHLENTLADFDQTLLLYILTYGAGMTLLSAILISRAMQPFGRLQWALAAVRQGDAQRLDGQFPAEVQPLADDLNLLLERTSELIRKARTQSGNIAHALKTPLAIVSDEAHRLEALGAIQSASEILDQCRKMQRHIDYETTRARAVAMRSTPGITASLPMAIGEVASALRRLYARRQINIEVEPVEELRVACDPEDLDEILGNLVDNACKHARKLVRVSAASGSMNGMVVIKIEDDGLGLDPETRANALRPGHRLDTSPNGSGLGLRIVYDLANLYGGELTLDQSPLGGLSAVLELPRVQN